MTLLAMFPEAALGAIVIYAATKLIEIPQLKRSQLLQKIGSQHIYLTLHSAIAAFQTRDRHSIHETTDSDI